MFDIIGTNHYWREPVKDRYLPTLEPLLMSGKPVVISEFGFLTCTDADEIGSWAPVNIDPVTMSLHLLPLTRRLVRPRVKTVHERNEGLQARCLLDQLELLDSAGVDGAFVFTFTARSGPMTMTQSTTPTPTPTASASSNRVLAADAAPSTPTWPGSPRTHSGPSPATTRATDALRSPRRLGTALLPYGCVRCRRQVGRVRRHRSRRTMAVTPRDTSLVSPNRKIASLSRGAAADPGW
jgi:hypothetical protein